MSTLFTRIINGEIPGRFVWREDDVVAFLTVGPLADGHTLVVPTEEVDRWTDASPELLARVMQVAQKIGAVQVEVFGAARAGLIVAGYEINHLHVHVWPSNASPWPTLTSARRTRTPILRGWTPTPRSSATASGKPDTRPTFRRPEAARLRPARARWRRPAPLRVSRRRQRLVQHRADPLLGDRIGGPELDGEEAHPELLDHPADLG